MKIFYNADIYGTKADAFVVDDDKFVYIGEKGDTNEERKCRSKGICY